jgi:hypothetical protein
MKTNHADVMLAKSRMEQDYLVHTCGMDSSVVEIGAPTPLELAGNSHGEDCIVFFSEPYEMSAGRTEEIYRDLIPGLEDLARRTGKALVVKLHPSENLRDRQSLAEMVLTREQRARIQWIAGPFDPALLKRTWFGVTVQSSVVIECAVQKVPCFLCEWMDLWPYGYITQYKKFGIAMGLGSPADIAKIPEMLADYCPGQEIADGCWQPLLPGRFEEMLEGRSPAGTGSMRTQRAK